MQFFKRNHLFRRFSRPINERGYVSIPYTDITLHADVQTTEDTAKTDADGTRSVQRLKVFCDEPLLVENQKTQQKGDRLYFQNKWFECKSCRLSDNTPIRHYTATFVECLDDDEEDEEDES